MEDFAVEKSKLKSKFSFLTGIGFLDPAKILLKTLRYRILQHHSSEILAFGFSGPSYC
uniref:Uncharacterized protein n=1 Tax=Cucumis melo TaxID=3656 RepID=A0A9I9E5U0_CUCME